MKYWIRRAMTVGALAAGVMLFAPTAAQAASSRIWLDQSDKSPSHAWYGAGEHDGKDRDGKDAKGKHDEKCDVRDAKAKGHDKKAKAWGLHKKAVAWGHDKCADKPSKKDDGKKDDGKKDDGKKDDGKKDDGKKAKGKHDDKCDTRNAKAKGHDKKAKAWGLDKKAVAWGHDKCAPKPGKAKGHDKKRDAKHDKKHDAKHDKCAKQDRKVKDRW